jgi:hypothetical protein
MLAFILNNFVAVVCIYYILNLKNGSENNCLTIEFHKVDLNIEQKKSVYLI